MKNIAFIFSILTFSTLCAQIESFDTNKLKYGGLLGYNFATQITEFGEVDSGGKDKATGLIFGGYIEHPLTEKIDIRFSPLYTSIKNENTEGGSSVAFLLLPIIGKYNFNDKISVLAGPQINYSLSDVGANTKKTSFAFSLGMAYNFSENIFIQGNYAIGLSNMVDYQDYVAKIHFLHFTVGYQF